MLPSQTVTFDDLQLNGRVAVVTGGSRGIGRGIAELLAERGAAVAVAYREQDETAWSFFAMCAGARARLGRAVRRRRRSESHDVFRSVASALGPVDILVNKAGINRDVHIMFMDTPRWTDGDSGDSRSVHCNQAVTRGMLLRGWGGHQHQLAEREDALPGQSDTPLEGRAGGFTRALSRDLAGTACRQRGLARDD